MGKELWDRVWKRPYTNYEKHHQLFWDLIRKASFGKILDMGCGSASCWRGTDFDVTGIDYSQEAINEARKNFPQGTFMVKDITDTPEGQFDTVVLSGVVNYYRDLEPIKKAVQGYSPKRILITINVINDFPDREWTRDRIQEEFSPLGEVRSTFYERVGWFIKIVL